MGESPRYVMVLDTSGSMGRNQVGRKRIDRMNEAAKNFIEFYANDGSQLGITHFSYSYNVIVDAGLTTIDENTRSSLSGLIDFNAEGATCLGLALQKGLEVLYGTEQTNGGVIIFLTDGDEECNDKSNKDDIDGNINNPELLQDIVDRNIRVVTIAFGKDASQDLENLARISGGKTFFVPDGNDNQAINDAFRAAMAYDPALPSSEQEVLIYSNGFSGRKFDAEGNFTIDSSIGNMLKIELNYNIDDKANPKLTLTYPDGKSEVYTDDYFDDKHATSFIYIDSQMQIGSYNYVISLNDNKLEDDSFIDIRITTKARDASEPPYQTRCWTSTGNDDLDASAKNLVVYAEVSQGNNAIINATVMAFITREGENEPVQIKLSDNGRGADLTAEDGIYSAYFIDYSGVTGRYTLQCETTNDDEAVVIKYDKTLASKFIEPEPHSPRCCGSTTANKNVTKVKTGRFERKSSGGSFKVIQTPSSDDTTPPSRIVDFKINNIDLDEETSVSKLEVSFTSPGDDLDTGTATKYELRFVNSRTLNNSVIDFDDAIPILEEDLISGSLDHPLESGETVTLEFDSSKMNQTNTSYFLLVRAVDEKDNQGEKSNQIRFCNECETPTTTTTIPSTTSKQSTEQHTTPERTTSSNAVVFHEMNFSIIFLAFVSLFLFP